MAHVVAGNAGCATVPHCVVTLGVVADGVDPGEEEVSDGAEPLDDVSVEGEVSVEGPEPDADGGGAVEVESEAAGSDEVDDDPPPHAGKHPIRTTIARSRALRRRCSATSLRGFLSAADELPPQMVGEKTQE